MADFTFKSTRAASGQQLKVIDLSDDPVKPNVLRRGKQVPFVALDPDIAKAVFVPDIIVRPEQAPRVVSQSIPAGTKVARGASVDLVLAPRTRIPGNIFAGGHVGFAQRMVEDIVNVLDDGAVFNAVVDFGEPDELPEGTRQRVLEALNQADIGIDDADPNTSFNAAFRTLKGAAAYK